MKLFCVQATVCHEKNGWRSMHQVPTFYIDADINGIRKEEEEVEKFAERMLRDLVEATDTRAVYRIAVSVAEV